MQRWLSRSRLLGVLLIVTVLVAACANMPAVTTSSTPAADVPTSGPVDSGTATPAPSTPSSPVPGSSSAVDQARAALAQQLGVQVEDVKVISSGAVDWPNGCLGVETPGIMCTDVIVPGYQVMLEAGGKQYEVRTSLSGGTVVVVPEGAGSAEGEASLPPAALRARERASADFGVELGLVKIVSAEPAEFNDGCLGLGGPAESCLQAITPGYRVAVEINGQQYVYHTDASGQNIRRNMQTEESPAATPTPDAGSSGQTAGAVISLRNQANGACTEVRVEAKEASFGACGGELVSSPFIAGSNRRDQLADMVRVYDSFSASTAAGAITFVGQGPIQATPIEQRMIAEWANVVGLELRGGVRIALNGMEWHREGGFAGFCDDITIDAGGHATWSSCKQSAADAQPASTWRRLTTDELTKFYAWIDTLGSVNAEYKDPAVADAMTIRASLAGRGAADAAQGDREGLLQFGAELLQQWADATPARFVSALAEVDIRNGPGETFDAVGQIAVGQQALVTGISRDGQWFRVSCPDNTVGACWVTADTTLIQPIAPGGSAGLQPTAEWIR